MKRLCYAAVFSVLLVAFPHPQTAHSASFDCKKAGTPTEKAICADPELSKMDEDMAVLYKEGTESLDDTYLDQSQRDWLKKRNECVGNMQCLKFAYQSRMTELRMEIDKVYAADRHSDDYYEEEPAKEENRGTESSGDKYIESVKEGFLDAHPTNSIGKSLSPPMFDNILWESQQAADGTWLVRFTGTVTKALNEKALQKLVFMSNHPRYTAIANHIIHNTKIFVPGEKAELIFTFTGEGRFTITRQYVPSCYNAGVKKSFMDDLITGIIFSPV